MLSAFPAGYLGDKLKRQTICRVSIIFAIMGILSFGLQMAFDWPYQVLYVGSLAFGLYWGAYSPAFESLFADSVPPG